MRKSDNRVRRFAAAVAAFAMVAGLVPAPALAEAANEPEAEAIERAFDDGGDESAVELADEPAGEEPKTELSMDGEDEVDVSTFDVLCESEQDLPDFADGEGKYIKERAAAGKAAESNSQCVSSEDYEPATEVDADKAVTEEALEESGAVLTAHAVPHSQDGCIDDEPEILERPRCMMSLKGPPSYGWNTSGTCEWSVDSEGVLTVRPVDGVSGSLDVMCPWASRCTEIKTVRFEGTISPSICTALFEDCTSLESVDLSGLDTSSATSMHGMFRNCSSLVYVDLSGLNTSSTTSIYGMFQGCSSLVCVDLSGLDTSSITNMSHLFAGCTSLKEAGISSLDVSAVTDMSNMFGGCESLTSLDLSRWDTSSVTSINDMFQGCSSLMSISFSGWDTSSVTDMLGVFRGCTSLEALDLSEWDTSSVTTMESMFISCKRLAELNLYGWNNASVIDDRGMFYNCPSISSITLGGGYAFSNSSLPTSAEAWWSTADRTWYTRRQIIDGRSNIADTYLCECPLKDIAGADIIVPSQVYTGGALTPTVEVVLDGTTLVEGEDYTVTYSDNVNVGIAGADVFGVGEYCGEAIGTFTISRASLSKATVSVKAQYYTGKALRPAPVVKVGGRTLKCDTDYAVSYKNNTKVGTATVTITGLGNYKGTKSVTFKIKAASVAKATVSKIASQKYDGTAKKPRPTVKVGTRTLKLNTDYALTYKNNVKAGTATVTIKGKGSYAGSKSVTFKIVAMAGTWKGSGSKWWYQWKDGTYPRSVFLDISGKTYRFDASGYCVYGWQQISGKYYYFDASGAMAKSKWVGNYWLGADGVMATSAWVDGGRYWVGADGAWVPGKTR